MHNRSPENRPFLSRHCCRRILPFAWSIGLVSGIAFGHCTESIASLMRGAMFCDVSIVGLCAVVFLPYLLTAFAVFFSRSAFLLLLAFSKAFFLGACSAAVDCAFGDAGWLIRLLLLFSDWASIPVIYWLWLRCFRVEKESLYSAFTGVLVILILIGSFDYWFIAPFLALVR